jgi:peroxiredoxin
MVSLQVFQKRNVIFHSPSCIVETCEITLAFFPMRKEVIMKKGVLNIMNLCVNGAHTHWKGDILHLWLDSGWTVIMQETFFHCMWFESL